METNRRIRSRAPLVLAGLLFVTLSYACTDQVSAPVARNSDLDFTVNEILATKVWRTNGTQPVYLGRGTSTLQTSRRGRNLYFKVGEVTVDPQKASPPPMSSSFGPTTGVEGPAEVNGKAITNWRARFNTPVQKLKTKDGKDVGIQVVDDKRGGGRPPTAFMIYDGDRPSSMHQVLYTHERGQWIPSRIRVTTYGKKDGRAIAVTEYDRAAGPATSVRMQRAPGIMRNLRDLEGTLARLVQPDALYAQGFSDCFNELAAVVGWIGCQIAADVALGLAIVACAALQLEFCAAIPALQAVSYICGVELVIAIIHWTNCAFPSIGSSGTGGGTGGGKTTCTEVIIEVSTDGGLTWQYDHTEWQC